MATGSGNGVFDGGLVANESLTAAQYKVVKLNSTGVVLAGGTAGARGILQNDPASGEPALVQYLGISKAVAAASLARGAFITANSTSQVTASSSSNDDVIGFTLEPSVNAGDIIRVMLTGASNY